MTAPIKFQFVTKCLSMIMDQVKTDQNATQCLNNEMDKEQENLTNMTDVNHPGFQKVIDYVNNAYEKCVTKGGGPKGGGEDWGEVIPSLPALLNLLSTKFLSLDIRTGRR